VVNEVMKEETYLAGKHYGKLTVVGTIVSTLGKRGKRVLCRCDCGAFDTFELRHLESGAIDQCGCSVPAFKHDQKQLKRKAKRALETQETKETRTKRCPRCTHTLSVDEFGKDRTKPQGIGTYYRPCKQARKKDPKKPKPVGPPGMRRCAPCNTWKVPEKDFPKSNQKGRSKDGRSYRCKVCTAAKKRAQEARKRAARLALLPPTPVGPPGTRLCTGADCTWKPLDNFRKGQSRCRECAKVSASLWRDANREEINARSRARRAANREAINARRRKNYVYVYKPRDPAQKAATRRWGTFRISPERWREMLGPNCDRCDRPFGTTKDDINVDHDHDCQNVCSGSKSCGACVRGVLCRPCSNLLSTPWCRAHPEDEYLISMPVAGHNSTN
jgi:Recombination endonuclease VII